MSTGDAATRIPATIRRAVPGDAPALTVIAHAAKRHWGYDERWIAAWKKALTVDSSFIERAEVFVAVRSGDTGAERVLGFHALVVSGGRASLEHLWVSPEHMGQGIGRLLVDHAGMLSLALGAESMLIESDPNAEAFYARLGARRVGDVPADVPGVARSLPLMELQLAPR
jgi:ribosomal protein S18 acetylase RimI-like enzyme